jgi:hypothetical protein
VDGPERFEDVALIGARDWSHEHAAIMSSLGAGWQGYASIRFDPRLAGERRVRGVFAFDW